MDPQAGPALSSALDLRRKEAVFWSILDTAGEGFITADEHGLIDIFNAAAERIFGFGPQDIVGQPVTRLFEDEGEKALERRGLQVLRGIKKDGQRFDCEATFSRLNVFDRSMTILIVKDITERLALESQSNQSQKLEAIGQLAAGIAHEINTPTQFVGDNVRFLKGALDEVFEVLDETQAVLEGLSKGDPQDQAASELARKLAELDLEYLEEEVPQAISQSIDGVERVAGIVRAMKNFSHPGSLGLGPVDLGAALQNTLTVSHSEWKYQAELELELEPDLPSVTCSEGEINQVFLNMIVNASHAIEAARSEGDPLGTLHIAARRDGEDVVIQIQDSGCGMPPEVQARIFDPFFTTKGVGKGTGQGLALASNVVRAHKGSIAVDSTPGEGTCFSIRLPISGPETVA